MGKKVALTVVGAVLAGVVIYEYRQARESHFFKKLVRGWTT